METREDDEAMGIELRSESSKWFPWTRATAAALMAISGVAILYDPYFTSVRIIQEKYLFEAILRVISCCLTINIGLFAIFYLSRMVLVFRFSDRLEFDTVFKRGVIDRPCSLRWYRGSSNKKNTHKTDFVTIISGEKVYTMSVPGDVASREKIFEWCSQRNISYLETSERDNAGDLQEQERQVSPSADVYHDLISWNLMLLCLVFVGVEFFLRLIIQAIHSWHGLSFIDFLKG